MYSRYSTYYGHGHWGGLWNDMWQAGTAFFPGSSLSGNGLLVSDGDIWKRQRRLSNPAFRKAAINTYAEACIHSETICWPLDTLSVLVKLHLDIPRAKDVNLEDRRQSFLLIVFLSVNPWPLSENTSLDEPWQESRPDFEIGKRSFDPLNLMHKLLAPICRFQIYTFQSYFKIVYI